MCVPLSDIKVCNQEMVRLVLDRLHSDRQTQRLLRVLRRVNRVGSRGPGAAGAAGCPDCKEEPVRPGGPAGRTGPSPAAPFTSRHHQMVHSALLHIAQPPPHSLCV